MTKPKLVASASLHDPASDEQDKLFANDRPLITDFRFNSETATVFDDMVGRSVPFYSEMQRMVCELAADFATDGSNL